MLRFAAALLVSVFAGGCAIPMGASGIPVSEYRLLNDEAVARVQQGQTRDHVLSLLGPPVQMMTFPRLGHTAWDYRITDTWGYQAVFSVTFDAQGIVVSKITQRLDRDRGSYR
jgi:outer membrane protein assembly factor BamE (lipoprotein component of BamABCDE complex)